MSYIEFDDVKKIYKMGDVKIKALNGASFTIDKGEFAVIAGASGAGKSTILNLMGGMDTATTGKIIVDKENVSKFTAKRLTTYRRYDIGFVLKERSSNFPAQLSGGEQQRVAIARALAKNPKLLLCDEPTGALDYNTGKQILKLLQDTCRERGVTVVVITHNLALTAMGDKVIKVKNGVVDSVTVNENPLPIEQIEW